MDFHLISLIIITLLNFFLGFLVWQNDKKNITNRSFGIFIFSVILWTIVLYVSDLSSQAPNALFWNKLTLVLGILFATTFAYFCLIFIRKEGFSIVLRTPFSLIILGFIIFLILVTLFTNLIVKKIEFYEWGTNIVTGNLYLLVAIDYLGSAAVGIGSLISKYRKSSGVEKKQVQFLLLGFLLSAVGILATNVILPLITGTNPFARYGPYFITFFIVFTTYAITRHHLLGIRVVLTEILVGAIGLVLLVQAIIAETLAWKIFGFILLILFGILGYLLIKTTLDEIRRRQEIEKLSEQIKIANIRLESALKALEKLDKAKTEFLSIASHQLRTPLTAIKGYLSMIQEGIYGRFSEEFNEILNKIYLSNTRLIDLVNSLLDISRIEMGRMEFKFEEIQIGKIIESIIEELSIQAKQKNLYLKFEKPKRPLPKIRADESKIRQVILNLIDNAIRYTEKGGVTIKVKNLISAIQISVRDTGIGLTPKEVESLFGMYARGKGMSIFPEGAGLGLYVARKLLEAHLGRIWAESAGKNKGSTFYVDLPVR